MFQLKFEGNDSDGEEYKIKAIGNNAVYARELESHLPGLYHLVSWKSYPKDKII